MSIRLMSQVWEKQLPPTDQRVLLVLCDFANDEGVCWPSIDYIAWKLGVDRKTVMRAIERLEAAGVIRVERQHRRNNRYTIDLEKLPDKPPFEGRNGTQAGGSQNGTRDRMGPKDGQDGTQEVPRWDPVESHQMGLQPSLNRQYEPSENNHQNDADASQPETPPRKRANDEAISLIDAYTEVSGKPFPAAAGKAINMAKALVRAGITPDDIRGCTGWHMADDFYRRKGFDWGTIVGNIDKWRGTHQATPEPVTIEERFGRNVNLADASAVPVKGKPRLIL